MARVAAAARPYTRPVAVLGIEVGGSLTDALRSSLLSAAPVAAGPKPAPEGGRLLETHRQTEGGE